jgi:hypothetical protein
MLSSCAGNTQTKVNSDSAVVYWRDVRGKEVSLLTYLAYLELQCATCSVRWAVCCHRDANSFWSVTMHDSAPTVPVVGRGSTMPRSPARSAKERGSKLGLFQGNRDHVVHKSEYGASVEGPSGSGKVECWRSLE